MDARLREALAEKRSIVFFGGAGVSTESGIPDFRSESGLYAAKQQFGHTPEEMLSHDFLLENPDLFFAYYKRHMIYLDARPNRAHLALARMEAQGRLAAVVTQNIDGLHQLAGSERVLELHGSVRRNHCADCAAEYTLAYILDPSNCRNLKGDGADTPRCAACGGVVRPDVVLYGEPLGAGVLQEAVRAIHAADALIVAGTSLAVYPAAGLLDYFRGDLVALINRTETPFDHRAGIVIRGSVGEALADDA